MLTRSSYFSYERVAWFPILIVYIIALGVSGKHLISSSPDLPAHGTASQVLSFGSTIAGFVISYCPLSSDYTSYFPPQVKGWKVFMSTFMGLFLPTVSSQPNKSSRIIYPCIVRWTALDCFYFSSLLLPPFTISVDPLL